MSAHWIVRAIRVSVVNGELANVIALALHGSAWLAEPSVTAPNLDQQNSTFRYVSRAQFESPQSRWRHTDLVSSSQSWLASLARDRVTRLWLVIPEAIRGPLEPHVAAGFSNGGRWGLLATGKRSSVWIPRWEIVDGNASDNRIWSVRFIGSEVKAPTAPSRPQTGPALTSLITALVDIREFARDRSLTLWAGRFDDAIDRAEAESPAIPYHPDMAPQSRMTPEAIRLLAASSQSWVFGGMGSWNDLWLDDPSATEQLERVTRNLYRFMLQAFVAATNGELVPNAAT
jgi:hypothetical protein